MNDAEYKFLTRLVNEVIQSGPGLGTPQHAVKEWRNAVRLYTEAGSHLMAAVYETACRLVESGPIIMIVDAEESGPDSKAN